MIQGCETRYTGLILAVYVYHCSIFSKGIRQDRQLWGLLTIIHCTLFLVVLDGTESRAVVNSNGSSGFIKGREVID
jgi:hypothetical protein